MTTLFQYVDFRVRDMIQDTLGVRSAMRSIKRAPKYGYGLLDAIG